ncbi:unnamed protein product [Schistosoma margrebowiei]|uniref:Uncharacterized protein n=1 Tax=Schistosoma margrebowiei TaxID=48269 RepID=A0A183MD90_9TREM|nr:unnamed protein product [Schistosoma margrebowiei]
MYGFNTASLRDTEKLIEFKIALSNMLQALQHLLKEEETVTGYKLKAIKETMTSICREVLGLMTNHQIE